MGACTVGSGVTLAGVVADVIGIVLVVLDEGLLLKILCATVPTSGRQDKHSSSSHEL